MKERTHEMFKRLFNDEFEVFIKKMTFKLN